VRHFQASHLGFHLTRQLVWDGRIPEQEVVRPLIAIRDKNEHLRRRRAWTRAFSSTAMKGYEPAVIQKCSELLEALIARTGKTINLSEWIGFFTYACPTLISREN